MRELIQKIAARLVKKYRLHALLTLADYVIFKADIETVFPKDEKYHHIQVDLWLRRKEGQVSIDGIKVINEHA